MLKNVSKAINDLRKIDNEDIFKIIESTFKQMDIENTILKPYYEAEKYGKSQYIEHKNLDDSIYEDNGELEAHYEYLEETNIVISAIINYNYLDILLDRLDEDYFRENILRTITIEDLAIAYCDKYGLEFTAEEEVMLQNELSPKETEYVSNSIKNHKR